MTLSDLSYFLHNCRNRHFSPEFCPTEPLKSAEKRVTARTEQ
jgi:hypothetical protein